MTKKGQQLAQQPPQQSGEQVMTPVSGKNGVPLPDDRLPVDQYLTSFQCTVVASPYAFLFSE
jgi:hypothetical protein